VREDGRVSAIGYGPFTAIAAVLITTTSEPAAHPMTLCQRRAATMASP